MTGRCFGSSEANPPVEKLESRVRFAEDSRWADETFPVLNRFSSFDPRLPIKNLLHEECRVCFVTGSHIVMVHERQIPEAPPSSVNDLSPDAVLRLLNQPMRRALLSCLYRRDEPLAVADVSKEIVWRTNDESRGEVTSDEAKDCYLSLHHRDIPKLAEYGVVTKDDGDNTVALTERGRELVSRRDDILDRTLA